MLRGVSSWNIELVREYIKKEQGVDIAAQPAAFPNHTTLAHVNSEFAARVRALMSVYQAHRGSGSPNIGIIAKTGGIRSLVEQRELYAIGRRIRQERRLFEGMWLTMPAGDGTSKEHWEKTVPQPPTEAWVSWHNLGLAVDLAYTNNDAFNMMAQAAADLGMVWGGWFGGEREPVEWVFHIGERSASPAEVLGWDLGHVEWHPRQRDADTFESQSGTPLNSDQLRIGYEWSLPEKIYVGSGQAHSHLVVHEFVGEGDWIGLTKMRVIQKDTTGDWTGKWYAFAPPVRLFPAWIPTVRLVRDSNDPSARGKTQVTAHYHHAGIASDGRPYSQHIETTGPWDYESSLRMTNWEIVANAYMGRRDPGWERFERLRETSEYDVEITLQAWRDNTISSRSLRVDADGYTKEEPRTTQGKICSLFLQMAWNRDRGAVGVRHEGTSFDNYDLVEGSKEYSVSASPLAGTFDMETPPPWPPAKEPPDEPPPDRNFWRP